MEKSSFPPSKTLFEFALARLEMMQFDRLFHIFGLICSYVAELQRLPPNSIALQKIQLISARPAFHAQTLLKSPCAGASSRPGRRRGNPRKEPPLNVFSRRHPESN